MFTIPRPFALMVLLLSACDTSKDIDTGAEADTAMDTETDTEEGAPTNLSLSVTVAGVDGYNPYGDGSGVVQLVAAADGAVSLVIEIDDQGGVVSSESAEVEHTFTQEGTHTYPVTVTAFAENGESTVLTEEVTVYASSGPFPTVVWADEFETDGALDPERWHHQTQPPENGGWYNGEQQHYTDRADNSYISDGTLKIVALREDYSVAGSARSYTSARLNARFAFTYGRVEVRAKLPAEAGTWPAIWTLGANIDEPGGVFGDEYGSVGWPACGEIDIMEQRGWDKATTLAYFHWGDTSTGAYGTEGTEAANATATTAFRVYALVWTEESLQVFIDEQLIYTLQNTAARPYDNPHYLLLNIAMGGNLGGSIPGDFSAATMEIDYVRIYQ